MRNNTFKKGFSRARSWAWGVKMKGGKPLICLDLPHFLKRGIFILHIVHIGVFSLRLLESNTDVTGRIKNVRKTKKCLKRELP